MSYEVFNQSAALTFPGFSQAVKANGFIFVSGQVALDNDANIVGHGDPAAQAERCLANLEVLLDIAGSSMQDVVRLNCYVVDGAAYEAYAEAKLRRFPDGGPAGTSVVVRSLLNPALLIEVEAIAVTSE